MLSLHHSLGPYHTQYNTNWFHTIYCTIHTGPIHIQYTSPPFLPTYWALTVYSMPQSVLPTYILGPYHILYVTVCPPYLHTWPLPYTLCHSLPSLPTYWALTVYSMPVCSLYPSLYFPLIV